MRVPALVALAMLFTLGCSLKRAPIFEGRDSGVIEMDTISPLDVPLPPTPDVPSIEIDAPSACATSCNVGERCEGATCVCTSDLCAGDRTCIAGACVACGGGGESCCPSLPCRDGLPCGVGGSCPVSRCNTVGDPCCEGDRCDGLTCSAGTCTAPCGASGQSCCPTGEACSVGLSCQSTFELPPRELCQSCGGFGELCCPGRRCDDSLACGTFSGRCF